MSMKMAVFRFRVRTSAYFFIFSISTIFIFTAINAEEDDEVYMSPLLKALSPTPPSWSNETHFCKWNGIVCNPTSNRVWAIILPSSSLTGILPPDLYTLTELTHIDLHNNFLTGPIPSLSLLKALQTVLLGHNNFTSIPNDCFHFVPSLRTFNISNNLNLKQFLFPTELALSRSLQTLDLQATNIKGSLPSEMFDSYPRLETIDLSHNNFIGDLKATISPTFANLLVNLTLSNNNLSGSIPYSLTTLPQLQFLDLSNNNLSGQIPIFLPKVKLNTTGNVFLLGRGADHDALSGGPSKTTNATSHRPIWIAGASVFSVVVAMLIVIICKRKGYLAIVQKRIFKKTETHLDDNVENFIKTYSLSVPKRYSYTEVKRITHSFRDKLGQGGYGVVYKASLPDGRQVAVKVIKESKGDGEEFINEVASISKTLHVNIVSLLGFCYEKNKRALIYEFMINGSLDRFIYRRGFPSAICDLDWSTLYQIVVGIARGLEYLHQGCTSMILHLDIKPQNILLDEDFCPKISDFGLAKICQKKDSIVSLLGTRGTIGFIAPEVFSRTYGGVSHKSDVYSYGMLILEMIGGRKNYNTGGSCTNEMYFPDWVYKDLELTDNLENRLAISEEEKDMRRKFTMVHSNKSIR